MRRISRTSLLDPIGLGPALALLLIFFSTTVLLAAEDELFEFFEQEAQTVTASRRLQSVLDVPVAVEVITSEEIRASGATTLWDLLRFRTGVDVVAGRSGDGNRTVLSVRGFPEEYVKSLQVLIDGRSAYNSLNGGVNWEQLPVQLQDIERIEIVRGPNAALYGSNAALGVINVITKKPSANRSVSAYGLRGNLDLFQSGVAYEAARDRFGYRLSYGYWNEDAFPSLPSVTAKDALTSHKANLRGFWNPVEGTAIEWFAGGSWDEMGVNLDREGDFRQGFEMLKYTQVLGPHSSLEVMVSRNDFHYEIVPDFKGRFEVLTYENQAEAVHHFSWGDGRLNTTWGGSYRHGVVKSDEAFTGSSRQRNQIRRGFFYQSVNLLEELTLVGAASLEHSNTGGTEPAFQAAAVITPQKDHVFRLSYSLAPTIPSIFEVNARHQPLSFLILEGNPKIDPHRLQSYEIGYQGSYLNGRLVAETDLFYMDLDDLSEGFTKSVVPTFTPPFFLITTSFDNANSAIARGGEARLKYRLGLGRSVYANYTYEHISDHLGEKDIFDGTPEHKVNLGAWYDFGFGLSGTVNLGYKSKYHLTSLSSFQSSDIPAHWRLDLRVGYRPIDQVEVFVAGKNLLDPRHPEFPDSLEVPRVYYAGINMTY